MSLQESPLSWRCGDDHLVGIVAGPAAATPHPLGVVIVVGGPQVRTGSHRMFTLLARGLAAGGVISLRFDVRGMGDSSGAPRGFEALSDDIASAIDALLREQPQLAGVVLWGLCDGASAALLYLEERRDPRVKGVCLANPWVRSAVSQARTQVKHYYRDRLRQPAFWMKLLRGGIRWTAWRDYWQARRQGRARAAPARGFQQRMAQGAQAAQVATLLVMSGNDYTAREFDEYTRADADWSALLRHPAWQRVEVPGADHTFSGPGELAAAQQATLTWLRYLPRSHGG